MEIMQKWNPNKKEYTPYSIPKEWNWPMYTPNMGEEINCTSCWKETVFWVCYTSKQIHNEMLFWYPVCFDCYTKEKK